MAAGLTALAVTWVLLIVAAPSAAAGRAPLVSALAYQIGSRVCHQRPERSFHVHGTQMPVCARCFGLYTGGAAGLLLAWRRRRPQSPAAGKLTLLAGAAPIALTVALEWLGVIDTTNALRWFTGVPLGFVAGVTIVGLFHGPD